MLTISPQSRTLLLKNNRVEVPYVFIYKNITLRAILGFDLATFESFDLPAVPVVTGALGGCQRPSSTPYLEYRIWTKFLVFCCFNN
jgi:hypothetical protein